MSATHVAYTEVVSHNIHSCSSNRYALENNFFRNGKAVLKDPGPVAAIGPFGGKLFVVTPVRGGSFNARALRWACSAVEGSAF